MFFEDIIKNTNKKIFWPFFVQSNGFNTTAVHGKFSVELFLSTQIVLKFKNEKLFLYGKNLELKNSNINDVLIVGEIFCISKSEVKFE